MWHNLWLKSIFVPNYYTNTKVCITYLFGMVFNKSEYLSTNDVHGWIILSPYLHNNYAMVSPYHYQPLEISLVSCIIAENLLMNITEN